MVETTEKPALDGERLAKVIARAGLCSRRDAEKWIAEGRVSVDGKVVRTPATNVTDEQAILVDGAALAVRHGTRLWLYHKPTGLVVTEKDPEGRETVFEKLEAEGLPRVVSVGRLDINTEGLLLLTNDGGLKRVLELPATGWLRKYRVRAFGSVDQARLDMLKMGMTVDGISYGPIEATLERVQGGNVWLVVALREGKNREIKNVLGALGLTVNRLIRISYGPFQLGDLEIGAVTLVKSRVLRDQLGEKLATQAGVDFDSAFPEETIHEKRQETAQKAEKNPRDPNARLRARPIRPGKKPAAPKPRTGEPRFAKQRAESKAPPPARGAGRFAEEPPVKRRVLFDDGRLLVEEAPRQRRDAKFGEAGREERRGPGDRSRAPAGSAPSRARSDRPERRGDDRRNAETRSSGPRPDRSSGSRSDRPSGPRADRAGGKPAGRFGEKPAGRFGDKPASRSDRPPSRSGPPRSDARKGPGGKPFGERSSGPRSDRPSGSRSDRPDGRPAGARADRPGGRPAGARADRPGSKPFGSRADRPSGSSRADRPGGKPAGSRADRPAGKPAGSRADRPGGKPASRSGGKPSGRPGARPGGSGGPSRPGGSGKPRTPRGGKGPGS
jgi:23S rRNA pseudouridine2605 synthase